MKRSKKALIAGLIFILAGIAVSFSALAMIDFNFEKLYPAADLNTLEIKDSFKNISVRSEQCSIIIKPSEDNICKIEYIQSTELSAFVKEDTLHIENTDNKKWYEYIGVFQLQPELNIYLPPAEYDKLNANSQSGDINISKGFSFNDTTLYSSSGNLSCAASASNRIAIKTISGDIYAKDLEADNLRLESSSGNISLLSASLDAGAELNSVSGDIKASDVRCSLLTAGSTSGGIKLQDVQTQNNLNIVNVSGDIVLDKSDAAFLRLKTTSGDISGNLLSPKIFNAYSVSGEINVPPSSSIASGECRINTVSGDIKIQITE